MSGRPNTSSALSAFWVGLLYDSVALDGAWDLVKGWSAEDREAAARRRAAASRSTPRSRGRSVRDVARDALALSRARACSARGHRDADGRDETHFLDPLDAIVARGRTAAERLLDRYHGPWGRSVEPAFEECVF